MNPLQSLIEARQAVKKFKRYVLYCDDCGNMVFENRNDALEVSENCRDGENKAYVRIRMFTQEELDKIPEAEV